MDLTDLPTAVLTDLTDIPMEAVMAVIILMVPKMEVPKTVPTMTEVKNTK